MKKSKDELKTKLSDIEYKVTQEGGTERPFTGKYWKFSEDGVYSCIVCDTPLFKSEDKFFSECGWPAFQAESYPDSIDYLVDNSFNMKRTEIKCKNCKAHLGHVFEDGPTRTGIRYCVNSASLNFLKK